VRDRPVPAVAQRLAVGHVVAVATPAVQQKHVVMHGWGWGWHRSHHEPRRGMFEKNDLFAVVGAAATSSA